MNNSESSTRGKNTCKLERKGESYFIKDFVIDQNDINNGMEISWLADDTEFEIWFPENRKPFNNNFPVRSNKPPGKGDNRIKLPLRNRPEKGTYYYAVYCEKNKTMAAGNSFPKMIIT